MEEPRPHDARPFKSGSARLAAIGVGAAIVGLFISSVSIAVGANLQSHALFFLTIAIASLAFLIWNTLPAKSAWVRIVVIVAIVSLVVWIGWPSNSGIVTVRQIAPKATVARRVIVIDMRFSNNSRFYSTVSVYKATKLVRMPEQNAALDVADVENAANVAAAENPPDLKFDTSSNQQHDFPIVSGPLSSTEYRKFSHGRYTFYVAEVMMIKGDIWPTRRTFCWYNQGNRQIPPAPCK